MMLKNSIIIESLQEHRLRLTSRLQVVELVHTDISAYFIAQLMTHRDPEQALKEADCDEEFSNDFMAFLDKNRMLYPFPPDADYIDASLAADALNGELHLWADALYCDPFWQRMSNPDYPGNLNTLYAWAIENYHHTHSVIQHLGAVIAHTNEPLLINKCITHLAEEWDHPYLFKISATRFRHAHQLPPLEENLLPLPSTQDICQFLQMAAKQHPFVYKSCVAVLEKTAQRVEETRQFYRHVAAQHALPDNVVAPLIKHAETDEEYDHLNSLSLFSACYGALPIAIVGEALRLAYRFTEALYLWQCHLLDIYLHQPLGQGHRSRRSA
ncbi:hypothetical protein [Yersinia aleksiciae]|uniref:Uncharacterized protein n=1 Tax=Yersinia aleksiciae TaxID=263819 RepID=A0A0T9UAB7_YERAE|nr:hypothetical protein [Yersinia aleksiciae]CNL27334.1 Uncharacterised protein [Yersinia aleksiciae]